MRRPELPLLRAPAGAGAPRVLLSTFGVTLATRPATPLPAIVVRAHDSAAVAVESVFAYRGDRYATLDEARVRGSDGARKRAVPVRFAAGASAAPLHGSAALGWYDEYAFAANKGQQLAVDGVRSPAHVSLTLFGPNGAASDLRAGVPLRLPATATYHLHVESAAEHDVPYTLRLAIRP